MIVVKSYINLFNLSWIKKKKNCLFLRNMEPLSDENVAVFKRVLLLFVATYYWPKWLNKSINYDFPLKYNYHVNYNVL